MNFKIEDYIDFHVLFMTISITIAYKYITNESNIIVEKKELLRKELRNEEELRKEEPEEPEEINKYLRLYKWIIHSKFSFQSS